MDKTPSLTSRRKRNVDRQPRLRILRTAVEVRVECHRGMKEVCSHIGEGEDVVRKESPLPTPGDI